MTKTSDQPCNASWMPWADDVRHVLLKPLGGGRRQTHRKRRRRRLPKTIPIDSSTDVLRVSACGLLTRIRHCVDSRSLWIGTCVTFGMAPLMCGGRESARTGEKRPSHKSTCRGTYLWKFSPNNLPALETSFANNEDNSYDNGRTDDDHSTGSFSSPSHWEDDWSTVQTGNEHSMVFVEFDPCQLDAAKGQGSSPMRRTIPALLVVVGLCVALYLRQCLMDFKTNGTFIAPTTLMASQRALLGVFAWVS